MRALCTRMGPRCVNEGTSTENFSRSFASSGARSRTRAHTHVHVHGRRDGGFSSILFTAFFLLSCHKRFFLFTALLSVELSLLGGSPMLRTEYRRRAKPEAIPTVTAERVAVVTPSTASDPTPAPIAAAPSVHLTASFSHWPEDRPSRYGSRTRCASALG